MAGSSTDTRYGIWFAVETLVTLTMATVVIVPLGRIEPLVGAAALIAVVGFLAVRLFRYVEAYVDDRLEEVGA
ncbi:hypothetical protein ACOZ4I_13620 [Haloarcula salina]|uniref:hypothetical protein n=1 Tax=Haloarcula salina TaxID=1429914 RepID=UPI003C6EF75A